MSPGFLGAPLTRRDDQDVLASIRRMIAQDDRGGLAGTPALGPVAAPVPAAVEPLRLQLSDALPVRTGISEARAAALRWAMGDDATVAAPSAAAVGDAPADVARQAPPQVFAWPDGTRSTPPSAFIPGQAGLQTAVLPGPMADATAALARMQDADLGPQTTAFAGIDMTNDGLAPTAAAKPAFAPVAAAVAPASAAPGSAATTPACQIVAPEVTIAAPATVAAAPMAPMASESAPAPVAPAPVASASAATASALAEEVQASVASARVAAPLSYDALIPTAAPIPVSTTLTEEDSMSAASYSLLSHEAAAQPQEGDSLISGIIRDVLRQELSGQSSDQIRRILRDMVLQEVAKAITAPMPARPQVV